MAQPSDKTGVQASQLHHTESGAMNLPYLGHAAAPYTEAPPDLFGNRPAISAYVKDWTKPISMDTAQMAKAAVPPTPPMPPMENSTSAGTPLATQNAPFQSIVRWSSPGAAEPTVDVAVICAATPSRSAP